MGLLIEDGEGSGSVCGVSSDHRIRTNTKTAERIYYCSRDMGDSFTIVAQDADPAAGEYTLWIQNLDEDHFVIHKIITGSDDANVVWKLWNVTGTGATAALITPVTTNLTSSLSANLTVRGGAGGVSGLTAVNTAPMMIWYQGVAFNTIELKTDDIFRIGQNQAIAIEYEEGTTNDVSITIVGYYDEIT